MKLSLLILLAVLSSACVQVRVFDCTDAAVYDSFPSCMDAVPVGIRG